MSICVPEVKKFLREKCRNAGIKKNSRKKEADITKLVLRLYPDVLYFGSEFQDLQDFERQKKCSLYYTIQKSKTQQKSINNSKFCTNKQIILVYKF